MVGPARDSNNRHPSLDDRFDPAVRMAEHDPAWADAASNELDRIVVALGAGDVRVEHVGSTSVPGLVAKPIVDLQVAVADVLDRGVYRGALIELGYTLVEDPSSLSYVLFVRPMPRPRLFHVHVCERGSVDEHRHLAVRDYLRAMPDEARAYGELKSALVARFPRDRLAYIAGKDDYVGALERRALRWARESPGR